MQELRSGIRRGLLPLQYRIRLKVVPLYFSLCVFMFTQYTIFHAALQYKYLARRNNVSSIFLAKKIFPHLFFSCFFIFHSTIETNRFTIWSVWTTFCNHTTQLTHLFRFVRNKSRSTHSSFLSEFLNSIFAQIIADNPAQTTVTINMAAISVVMLNSFSSYITKDS